MELSSCRKILWWKKIYVVVLTSLKKNSAPLLPLTWLFPNKCHAVSEAYTRTQWDLFTVLSWMLISHLKEYKLPADSQPLPSSLSQSVLAQDIAPGTSSSRSYRTASRRYLVWNNYIKRATWLGLWLEFEFLFLSCFLWRNIFLC